MQAPLVQVRTTQLRRPPTGATSIEGMLCAAFRAGATPEEIARRSGCSPALVARVLGEAGLLPRRRGRRWPYDPPTEIAIARAYEGGATMDQLVVRHGGTHRSIRHVLDHRGVTTRPAGRPRRTVDS